jgi:glycosyltransferase involved in cell wall biosynthesis
MVKAADVLADAGYDVRVVSTMATPRLGDVDRRLHGRRRWRWSPIERGRTQVPLTWLVSGGRTRAARHVAAALGSRTPYRVAARAYSRVHAELLQAIAAEPADLIYAGTNGAIAASLDAAAAAGVPCGIDFEDFHCGEQEPIADGPLVNGLADVIMADASRRAAFLTAGSEAIAAACAERFGRAPLTINNVFPLSPPPVVSRGPGPLRLYWFSQTIGHGRGLEEVTRAAGQLLMPVELHLRGVPASGYLDRLRACAATAAPQLAIHVHDASDPDDMVESCRPYDVGIAAEPGHIPNGALALSNKALTYPLAALALVLSDTPGQRPLADTLNGEAAVYAPGDTEGLADHLRRWATDPARLRRARDAAWEAARSRWHWEHPLERDALLDLVAKSF